MSVQLIYTYDTQQEETKEKKKYRTRNKAEITTPNRSSHSQVFPLSNTYLRLSLWGS
jgi:hypothetical protein